MPLKSNNWTDYLHNSDPKCPHCDKDFIMEFHPEKNDILIDQNHTIINCPECHVDFNVDVSIEYAFSTDDNLEENYAD